MVCMNKNMPGAASVRLVLAVALVASVTFGCGKTETPTAGAPKAATPQPEGPLTLEPAAVKAADLKPGLKLTTFPNNTFSGAGESTVVPALTFDCDKNPYNGKEVSLRWEGYLKVESAGEYCFQTASDDQSTFSLGKTPVIVQTQSGVTKNRRVNLKEGVYELTLDYQNNVGPACMRIGWSKTGCGGYVDIPATQLLH